MKNINNEEKLWVTRFVSAKTFSLNLFVICVNHYLDFRRLLKWQKILIIIVDLGIYKYYKSRLVYILKMYKVVCYLNAEIQIQQY